MIKLFRQIRYQLIKQKNTMRYFQYAIGEIALVFIGILIALQINYWNEAQKARTHEITMLKEISEALQTDLKGLESAINYLQKVRHSIRELARIQNDRDYPLEFHMDILNTSGEGIIINQSPYEALKSSGMDRISNPELRNSLSDLYGIKLLSLEAWINEIVRKDLFDRSTLFNTLFPPYIVAEGEGISNQYQIKDMNVIYEDPQFDRLLSMGGSYIPMVLNFLERTVTQMGAVHNQISEKIAQ